MLRNASATTRNLRHNFAAVITQLVPIIRFAPLGIFGLVTSTINMTGIYHIEKLLHVLFVLLGCMILVALIINFLLFYRRLRRNQYPLIFCCLRESGVTTFLPVVKQLKFP